MKVFSRSILVGAEFPDDETIRFHGLLEDHIYAMEIKMDVRISDGVIETIEGRMKRYTTPVCPEAVPILQGAVGVSLRGEGWVQRVFREIGRKGCQHFAEIIIECGRSLDSARLARTMGDTLRSDPGLNTETFARQWIEEHPEARSGCLAGP